MKYMELKEESILVFILNILKINFTITYEISCDLKVKNFR